MQRVYGRGRRNRASGTVRDRLLDDLEDVVANELVALEERLDEPGVDVAVLLQHGGDPLTLGGQDVFDLLLGLGVREHLADEVRLRKGPVGNGLVADQRAGHAERTDPLRGTTGRVCEVVSWPGPRLAEAQLLGGDPAERDRDAALDLGAG